MWHRLRAIKHFPSLSTVSSNSIQCIRFRSSPVISPDQRTHFDSLYLTSVDVIKKTSPILLGLAHILEQKFTSVGYFRPISPSANSSLLDHHLELMHSELELPHKLEELYGVTDEHALECWLNGKEDDLIEDILNAYEKVKAAHDFVIIEGSSVTEHESAISWKMNVDIAKALGSPVLLLNDFGKYISTNQKNLEDEIVSRLIIGKEQVEAAGMHYFGTIANRVRTKHPSNLRQVLRERFEKEGLPFLGFLPFDEVVASKRLNEVAHKIGAKPIFGANQIANNVVVSDAIVATSHLKDLFIHMKKKKDGLLVITSADRSDVMLGLLASRIPNVLPSVSGIVLTNGDYPHSNTQEILQGVAALDKTGMSIPIFVVPEDSYHTANAFSRASTDILPTSVKKIQQCKNLFDEHIEKTMLIGELDDGVVIQRSPKHFKHFAYN